MSDRREVAFSNVAVYDSAQAVLSAGDHEVLAQLVRRLCDPVSPGRGWWRSGSVAADWSDSVRDVSTSSVDLRDTQVFLDYDRAKALTEQWEGDIKPELCSAPMCLTIDFSTFHHQIPEDTDVVTISVGAWTDAPESPNLVPPDANHDRQREALSPLGAARLLDERYQPLVGRLSYSLCQMFAWPWGLPRARGRLLQTPTCYFLLPREDWPEYPEEWLTGQSYRYRFQAALQDILAINSPEDERLSASVYGENMLTLHRRFSLADRVFSTFAFLPAGQGTIPSAEEQVRRLKTTFEALDIDTSRILWNIARDLETLEDRIGDFQAIASEANGVLDPLLRELLNPSGDHVEATRETIDLVRITLLQGEPEIANYRVHLRSDSGAIQAQAEWLLGEFSGRGQRPIASVPYIPTALTEPLERERRRVHFLLEAASQDSERLVTSASSILAERREQDVAALSKSAHRFNVLLFSLAIATAADLLVNFSWQNTWPWLKVALRALVLAAVMTGIVWLWLSQRRGRDRRREQNPLTQRAVEVVKLLSVFKSHPLSHEQASSFDMQKAGELAAIWDEIDAMETEMDAVRQQVLSEPHIRAAKLEATWVVKAAELWSIKAVLTGERPHPLPRSLPIVTCLYHFREQGRFVSPLEFEQAVGPRPGLEDFRQEGIKFPRDKLARELVQWIAEHLPPIAAQNTQSIIPPVYAAGSAPSGWSHNTEMQAEGSQA